MIITDSRYTVITTLHKPKGILVSSQNIHNRRSGVSKFQMPFLKETKIAKVASPIAEEEEEEEEEDTAEEEEEEENKTKK